MESVHVRVGPDFTKSGTQRAGSTLKTTATFIGHVNKRIFKNQRHRDRQSTGGQDVQEQGIRPSRRHTPTTCRVTGRLKHRSFKSLNREIRLISGGPVGDDIIKIQCMHRLDVFLRFTHQSLRLHSTSYFILNVRFKQVWHFKHLSKCATIFNNILQLYTVHK